MDHNIKEYVSKFDDGSGRALVIEGMDKVMERERDEHLLKIEQLNASIAKVQTEISYRQGRSLNWKNRLKHDHRRYNREQMQATIEEDIESVEIHKGLKQQLEKDLAFSVKRVSELDNKLREYFKAIANLASSHKAEKDGATNRLRE